MGKAILAFLIAFIPALLIIIAMNSHKLLLWIEDKLGVRIS